MLLAGKTAIVTGSGKGIGAGIALALARQGALVGVNARKAEGAADTIKEIEAAGGKAVAVVGDVAKGDQVAAMVAQFVKDHGRIDILVNNAGTEAPPCQVKDIPEEQWDHILGTNLKSAFLCCKAVIPHMTAQDTGRIIMISSLAGRRMSFFGSADYTASKHGMVGLANHLAWELAEHHITVNVICPGAVLTPLAEKQSTPEYREMVGKRLIPLGRWCTPEDIAAAAVFFASDHAALVTGQMMDVDGGVMTGYGEDLRPMIKQRMAQEQARHAQQAAH